MMGGRPCGQRMAAGPADLAQGPIEATAGAASMAIRLLRRSMHKPGSGSLNQLSSPHYDKSAGKREPLSVRGVDPSAKKQKVMP